MVYRIHRALWLWYDEPGNNKESNRLLTLWPFWYGFFQYSTAYMDYMDLAVCCPRKAVKFNHSLTFIIVAWHKNIVSPKYVFESCWMAVILGNIPWKWLVKYSTPPKLCTWFMFFVFCCGLVMVSFTCILQGYFTGTTQSQAMIWLPLCHWGNHIIACDCVVPVK